MPEPQRDSGMESSFYGIPLSHPESLEYIINSLADGVIIVNREGKFTFFNQAAREILGIGLQDIDATQWTAIYGCYYPDETTPYPSELLPLSLAMNGEVIHDELIYIRNQEKTAGVYISVSAAPLRNPDGEIDGGTIIIRDVTEQKRAVARLRHSEERLQAQFDGFPIPTYVWKKSGADFHLLDYNLAAYGFTKGKVKEFLGKNLQDIYVHHPDVVRDMLKCHEEGTVLQQEMNYRLYTTGEWKDLEVTLVPIPPDMVAVHTKDITDRKRAEHELKKLSSAVEQTADSVLITDARGVVIWVNPAFEKTTGYPRHEIIGKKPNQLKSGHHPRAFYDNLWKQLLGGQPFRASIVNRKKDGSLYWSEQTITPMKEKNGEITHFVAVMKDMTDYKERQEQEFQLRIAHEIQQQLNKAHVSIQGFDIAGISHSMVHTSGDYYDFFTMGDGSLAIAVADVSGHGIGAALIMASTRAYMRAFARTNSDPAAILDALNRELCHDLDTERYVTLMLARVLPQSGQLEYASAGHVPAFLLNQSGELYQTLPATGVPLGWLADYAYTKSERIDLAPHTLAVFVTDGLTEASALDKKQFGFDRILKVVKQHKEEPAEQIVKNLYERVRTWSGKAAQEDDITAIVCKLTT